MAKLARPILLAAAATMLTGIAPATERRVSPQLLELLDPVRQMRNLCGNGRNTGSALRERLRLAAAYQAKAAPQAGTTPLLDGLGTNSFPVTTADPLAQRYFDQGMMLSYGFNHSAAIRAFREAQRRDPDCAMCWWGEALAHGPNINAPMDPAVQARTLTALHSAVALKPRTGPEEQALIGALERRYSVDPKADRMALDTAYAEAMLDAAARFPAHDNIAILAAEAVMDTRPWDYWEADRKTPKGRIGEAVTLVERVLARDPNHAQAAHLYIHLVEASADPARALPAADRLAKPLVPGAGHLVHMPSHLYLLAGRHADSIRVNIAAARADEAYLKMSGDGGLYLYGYYPHNVHFIVVSAQMAGDMKTAITEAQRLRKLLSVDVSSSIAWLQAIDAAPYLVYAQFAPPVQILALSAPDPRLPYVTAMRHYARAIAHAQRRDTAHAEAEIASIARIHDTADFKWMTDQGMPAPDLLRIAEHTARARLAYARGRYGEAARHYHDAIAIEDGIVYQEPPYWYYPVRQSLGAALYRSGDLDGARQAFLDTLARTPNNGWALYGLAMTQRAMGDRVAAAASEAALGRAWIGDRKWLSIDRL